MAVTLAEAAEELGYSKRTLDTYRSRRDGFPAPVGRRGQAYLYDLGELAAWLDAHPASAVRNRRATRHDDGQAVTCLECGVRLRSLAQHLQIRHGLTSSEYIERHNLPRTTALQSRVTRERHAATMTPERAALMHGGDAPGRSSESAKHTKSAHLRDGVAELRAPGQAKGVAAMVAARRARLEARMRQLGYAGLTDAVAQTLHMSAADAAARLQCGVTSIRRWRRDFQA